MSTPEERLRKKVDELAREMEERERVKQGEEIKHRASLANKSLRASTTGRKFHRRAQQLRDATERRIYLGFDYERREGMPIQGFDLMVGRLYGLRAYLEEDGWHVRVQGPEGLREYRYATDDEFESAMDTLLEVIVGAALEALMRGKDQSAPEWSP